MVPFTRLWRGVALAVACAAASAALLAFGGTPAFALSLVQIYGSGASLQEQLQTDILIPDSGISPAPIYTSTTSGKGAAEFGFENSKLNLAEDPEANKAGQLDGYIGQDSPPSSTQLEHAKTASGSNAVTVPVAQTALALPLAFPVGIDFNAKQKFEIPLGQLAGVLSGTCPASTPYAKNTWGACLILIGLKPITIGSPSVGQFRELGTSGAKTGGYTPLAIELRKNGAGTTLNLKQFLDQVEPSTWGTYVSENSYPTSSNWPAGEGGVEYLPATEGNSTDASEVSAVMKTPGTIGYGTIGDVISDGFTNLPTSLGEYDVAYAELQDNFGSSSEPIYADPVTEEGKGTQANIYTGSGININGGGGAGDWLPPTNWYESWGNTNASDPNVYEDAGETGDYYPLVSVAYDIAWLNYSASGLSSDYGASPTNTGYTTQQLLEFATSSTGQSDIASGGHYYAKLPSGILTDAQKAAAAVDSSSE